MANGLRFSDHGLSEGSDYTVMLCPSCGSDATHVDDVHVGGRPVEDGDWQNVIVDAKGHVARRVDNGMAAPRPLGEMRRHYISLVGWCEECGERFAIGFVQHKGATHVYTLANRWTPLPKS